MNKIKFKGLTIFENHWIYGTPRFFKSGRAEIFNLDESFCVKPETICQFTGIIDKDGVEIYGDDIRTDGEHRFRIYQIQGGFAFKPQYWWANMNDLIPTDEFIMMPIAEPQTIGWLIESTTAAGNYHDINKEEKQ